MSSPAAAAAAAAAGLFPPGLEALYRQAGFPTAFLGLGAGAAAGAAASAVTGHGTGGGSAGNPGGSSTPLSSSSNTTTNSPYTHVGLQSHANNPSCKYKALWKFQHFLPLRFYVKSNLENLEVLEVLYLPF